MSKYWKTKPVLKSEEFVVKSSEIENLQNRSLYNKNEPINIPSTLEWNINNDKQKVCDFLNKYYSDTYPKLVFTVELLSLCVNTGFILSIVNKQTLELCGVICCEIKNTVIFDKKEKFAHAKFLCAHPLYRKKNIAQTLMTELTRYLFMNYKISQGYFTTKNKVIEPLTTLRVYRRPINYLKLYNNKFMNLPGNSNTIHKKYIVDKLPNSNYQLMQKEHIDIVYDLYNYYMSKFNFYSLYTKTELENVLLNDVVKSYVILNENKVVDFVSYYCVNYDTNNELIHTGHLFLYTLNSEYGEFVFDQVLKIMASNNIDILITNDTMAISDIILSTKSNSNNEESDSDSYTHIYEHKCLKEKKVYLNLFNWKCPYVSSDRISYFSLD